MSVGTHIFRLVTWLIASILYQAVAKTRSTVDERAALDHRKSRTSRCEQSVSHYMTKRLYRALPGERFVGALAGKRSNKVGQKHQALLERMQERRCTNQQREHQAVVSRKHVSNKTGHTAELLPLAYRLHQLQLLRSKLVFICKHVKNHFGVDFPPSKLLTAIFKFQKFRLRHQTNGDKSTKLPAILGHETTSHDRKAKLGLWCVEVVEVEFLLQVDVAVPF